MERDLIADILKYFTSTASPWRSQWDAAKGIFLAHVSEQAPEYVYSMLAEWFLFDYRLPTGRSPLAEYVETNPETVSAKHLAKLRPLLDNHYGIFSVVAIKTGKGLRLKEEGGDGRTYDVVEKTMTYCTKRGDLTAVRLCLYEGEWFILGGNSPLLNEHLSAEINKAVQDKGGPLTPKLVMEITCPISIDGKLRELMTAEPPADSKCVDYGRAKADLDALLHDLRLDRLVTIDLIEGWYHERRRGEEITPTTAVLGLLDERSTKADFNRLVQALTAFGNAVPRAGLGGKSPQDLVTEQHEPEWHFSYQAIGLSVIEREFNEAMAAMKNRDPESAANLYEACFSALLAAHATLREPWRLYANFAVALQWMGDLDLAEAMADASLLLNYNYEFGIEVAANVMAERKRCKIRRDRIGMAGERYTHPAFLYLDFLNELGIDFSTEKLTVTPRTIFETGPATKKGGKGKK